jgi:hypothetical protein
VNSESKSKPVEQIVAAIEALDLEPIKFKLMDPDEGQGWSREYVEKMAIAYKRFLTLVVKHPETAVAPSKDIDKFWHGHILDTMKYAEDCERVFGYFLHHFPYFGMRGAEDAAQQAQADKDMHRLYEQEFGEPMPQSQVAYCAAATKATDAAYCAAGKKASDAAYCAASKPAYCAASKKATDAAYCAASKPAYCAAGKKATDAAYCAASKPAYCAASKKATDAAYCAASKPAYCAAGKKATDAAYCAASKPAYCAASKPAYCAASASTGKGQQDLVTRPTLAMAA